MQRRRAVIKFLKGLSNEISDESDGFMLGFMVGGLFMIAIAAMVTGGVL